jgi:copper(I)-binding protein
VSDLARAAAGPVICAAVLISLLSAWVASAGAGSLTRVRIQVTMAAVPMRAFTPRAAGAIHEAGTYLTIRNLSDSADELIAVRSPIAGHITLDESDGLGGVRTPVSALAIPAHGTLSLSPITDDAVLEAPAPFEDRQTVPITLVFRDSGQITVDAPVTAPDTPLAASPLNAAVRVRAHARGEPTVGNPAEILQKSRPTPGWVRRCLNLLAWTS